MIGAEGQGMDPAAIPAPAADHIRTVSYPIADLKIFACIFNLIYILMEVDSNYRSGKFTDLRQLSGVFPDSGEAVTAGSTRSQSRRDDQFRVNRQCRRVTVLTP